MPVFSISSLLVIKLLSPMFLPSQKFTHFKKLFNSQYYRYLSIKILVVRHTELHIF